MTLSSLPLRVRPPRWLLLIGPNEEEAKQVEDLKEDFKDVVAVKARPEPSLVAPVELKVDITQ
jgi:hypothetical protein